jgi:hypothetical protein
MGNVNIEVRAGVEISKRGDVLFPDDDRLSEWEYVNGQCLAYAVRIADSDSVVMGSGVSAPVDTGVLDPEFVVSTREGGEDRSSPDASRVTGDGQGVPVTPANDGGTRHPTDPRPPGGD